MARCSVFRTLGCAMLRSMLNVHTVVWYSQVRQASVTDALLLVLLMYLGLVESSLRLLPMCIVLHVIWLAAGLLLMLPGLLEPCQHSIHQSEAVLHVQNQVQSD